MNFKYSYFHLAFLMVLWGCGDPAEQQANREKLMEGLKDHKVTRVTEERIHSAAYEEGNRIVEQLNAISSDVHYWITEGQPLLDSINRSMDHNGFKLITTDTPAEEQNELETALFEAYQYSSELREPLNDNVQNSGEQQLLFTRPLTRETELIGMWSLMLSRKTLIREL